MPGPMRRAARGGALEPTLLEPALLEPGPLDPSPLERAPRMTFRHGHAAHDDWQHATDQVIAQLCTGGRPPPGLGFAYVADRLAPHTASIVERLIMATGIDEWVGAVGIGVLATGIEYMDQPAISAMVTDWPAGEYSVFSGRRRAPLPSELTPSGAQAAQFAIVHADPNTADMSGLIEDMSDKTGTGFLIGGLASSRGENYLVANEVLQGGLSGVMLSSAIPVHSRLTQGCTPLPGRHIVTKVDRHIIAAIDGRPALDVFREAAGPELAKDLRRAAFRVLVGLPVEGSDTGDYLVRNIVGIDPKSGLIAIGEEVSEGQALLFCERGGDAARTDLVRMVDELKAALDAPAKGALYVACVGRGEHMFGERSAELALIREHLGDLPLVGFFANGEIANNRLYGYTGVLTVFT